MQFSKFYDATADVSNLADFSAILQQISAEVVDFQLI